jgi:CRISPR-associated protein Cas2
MLVAIAYDIRDDRRRTRLAKLLSRYGNRVQYSLFEAEITDIQLRALQYKVRKLIDEQSDSVRYYLLGNKATARVRIEGLGEFTKSPDFLIV